MCYGGKGGVLYGICGLGKRLHSTQWEMVEGCRNGRRDGRAPKKDG